MNIALTSGNDNGFYLASVRKTDKVFLALGKRIDKHGHQVSIYQTQCESKKEAEKKAKCLARNKMKCRGWSPVDLNHLPPAIVRFVEVPPEMRVTPEELVMMIHDAQLERYIVFENTSGLEEYFDAGVEYLGYETDDKNVVKVFDRFGTLRDCFIQRVKLSYPTERAIEASGSSLKRVADSFSDKDKADKARYSIAVDKAESGKDSQSVLWRLK